MNDRLYIGINGHVAAIRVEDGHELWRTKLGDSGLFGPTSYQDVCVMEHEDKIFAGSHGHLFCLDAGTGSVLWHNGLKGLGHNDVTLAMVGKSVQYISSHSTSSS